MDTIIFNLKIIVSMYLIKTFITKTNFHTILELIVPYQLVLKSLLFFHRSLEEIAAHFLTLSKFKNLQSNHMKDNIIQLAIFSTLLFAACGGHSGEHGHHHHGEKRSLLIWAMSRMKKS